MKKFLKIVVLIVAEIAALFVAYQIQQAIEWRDQDNYDYYDYEKNRKYEVREYRKSDWDLESPMRKAVYYLPENRIVREWDITGINREVLNENMNGYAIIDDGKDANLFGPDGNPVFKEDFKDGLFTFVHHGQLITNRMNGEYYDLQGQPVSNFYTLLDRLDYKNPDALYLSIFAFFIIVTFMLWYFLLWRKKKNMQ